jgi:hypothetical protein
MTITRLNSGYYKVETSKETFQIVAYNTDVKEPIFWMVQRINGWGSWVDIDVEFRTKKECVEYIKNELI